jgi:transcription elongation factor Elf1
MKQCTQCNTKYGIRNTKLTELINVYDDLGLVVGANEVDVNVFRCSLCGHYEFTKKPKRAKKPKKISEDIL